MRLFSILFITLTLALSLFSTGFAQSASSEEEEIKPKRIKSRFADRFRAQQIRLKKEEMEEKRKAREELMEDEEEESESEE